MENDFNVYVVRSTLFNYVNTGQFETFRLSYLD